MRGRPGPKPAGPKPDGNPGVRGGIGVLGGTFNPIHIAHLRAAEEIREILGLEKVIFVPAGVPPLKGRAGLAPAGARLKMVKLAIRGNPFFEVSDLEVAGGAPSYTVNTLERLGEKYGSGRLFFITGLDVFKSLHLWWRPERLIELADFVVMSRPGYDFSSLEDSPFISKKKRFRGPGAKGKAAKLELASGRALYLVRITDMDISARGIRQMLASGGSARYLLPEAVLSFIISNKLKF
ncbi:MAG: nicotinate-nucleotide adenylyltransferase [Nitrospiraceae bacterium]|nr:nicotinate-nucleotide adenylyltransferase [Nitrospiraceae bacterium]